MANEIYLTRVGMTMTEGTVAEWYAADGDRVAKGELLYRLETEKVELDVDADDSGIVKHVVEAGATCEPGDVVGWIYAANETIPDVLPKGEKLAGDDMPSVEPSNTTPTSSNAQTPSPAVAATTPADIATRGIGGRGPPSPGARALAPARGGAVGAVRGARPRRRRPGLGVAPRPAAGPPPRPPPAARRPPP
nr:biotin/lipoyl-binding protein [Pseudomonadota bacterium]